MKDKTTNKAQDFWQVLGVGKGKYQWNEAV
jgi:hypothetical protein